MEVVLASGEKEQYELQISTTHEYISRLLITCFDKKNGERTLLDEEINQKSLTTKFIFTAPEIGDVEGQATLSFKVWDEDGHTAQVERTVKIVNKIVMLPELTGIVLHSPYSDLPDALSFQNASNPFKLEYSPEPEKADLFLECNEDFTSISWKSNTKAKFIRNNTFNYSEASGLSINAVYESSLKTDYIDNIKPNDIIIVGHGTMADGVFFVNSINRGSLLQSDYMIVSYKPIKETLPSDTPSDNENSDSNNQGEKESVE